LGQIYSMTSDRLTDRELRRYQRQIILPDIGKEGQLKLKKSRVLVIGVGGLGTPILQYLSAGGVGRIGIVDHDIVSESNLQRQILFGSKDLGKLKAIIARERLSALNPECDFQIHNLRITRDNILRIIGDYDLVFDASDNFPTRYLINDACVILGKTWVYGAIYSFEGHISVFNYNGGPTLRCLFPDPPAIGTYQPAGEIGLLGVLPGMVGCYQASEAIKVITGYGEILSGRLLNINIKTNTFRTFEIPLIRENREITDLREKY
jgi:molybdopterin/thiamine biosynthesis adenylyltransferase